MKITELGGKHVKIGKTSITAKDPETGKTCGVVRGICKFMDLQANKSIDYFGKIRNTGAWCSGIDGLIDCIIFADNQLYYLHNLKPINSYNKLFAGHEGFDNEKAQYEKRMQIAENMKRISTVIPCYVD